MKRKKRKYRRYRRWMNRFLSGMFVVLLFAAGMGLLFPEALSRLGSVIPIPEEFRDRIVPERTGNPDFPDDSSSLASCIADPWSIPDYDGADYVVLNDGKPNFTAYDLAHISGETYAQLDEYGRCGPAVALLDRSMMPQTEREPIGDVHPSGWHTVKYPDLIEDQYLYNRCHLIAYAMTGQNANERNLITGTRHMNTEGMLPFEIEVLQYLDDSDNHVLYRVTPFFQGDELVARGVEMEAYSVEDLGSGVSFHMFVYNVQPGIEIDYRTGESCEIKSLSNAAA